MPGMGATEPWRPRELGLLPNQESFRSDQADCIFGCFAGGFVRFRGTRAGAIEFCCGAETCRRCSDLGAGAGGSLAESGTEPRCQPHQRTLAEQHESQLRVFQPYARRTEYSASHSHQAQRKLELDYPNHSAACLATLSQPEYRRRIWVGRHEPDVLLVAR